ncbi:MAG: hypothetical protein JWO13_3846, partial [Acidobacteriales bacterium]|nr:hypothetical protein [Terriglobales bacterium]
GNETLKVTLDTSDKLRVAVDKEDPHRKLARRRLGVELLNSRYAR